MSKLILGLGNPGPRYSGTRHNVGFRVVEELASRWRLRLQRLECSALVAGSPDGAVLLAKPQTYMNRSGYAARCLVERRGFEPSSVLVVFDEVHLEAGKLRLRRRGSPGGHRGLESVLENLETAEVPRLRLGVAEGPPPDGGEELVEYVLAPPSPEHEESIRQMIIRAADACERWLEEGIDAAMNEFNG